MDRRNHIVPGKYQNLAAKFVQRKDGEITCGRNTFLSLHPILIKFDSNNFQTRR